MYIFLFESVLPELRTASLNKSRIHKTFAYNLQSKIKYVIFVSFFYAVRLCATRTLEGVVMDLTLGEEEREENEGLEWKKQVLQREALHWLLISLLPGVGGNTTICRSEVFQVVPALSSGKGRLGKRCSVGKIIYKLILNAKKRKDSTGLNWLTIFFIFGLV